MNYILRVYSATRCAHVCVARQACVHRIVRYASPRADRLLYRDTQYWDYPLALSFYPKNKWRKSATCCGTTLGLLEDSTGRNARARRCYLRLTRQVVLLYSSGSITVDRRRGGWTAQCYRYGRRRAPVELGSHGKTFSGSGGVGGFVCVPISKPMCIYMCVCVPDHIVIYGVLSLPNNEM